MSANEGYRGGGASAGDVLERGPTTHAPVAMRSGAATGTKWIYRIFTALRALEHRTRVQQDLQYLLEEAPPHILKDVGLTRDQIEQELHRLRSGPFL